MARILIIYGTAYGQTERIAQEIAKVLKDAGNIVSVVMGDHLPIDLSLDEYDGFVVAASVLFGRHQQYIRAFVRDHRTYLEAVPTAFVSVCGAMGEPNQGALLRAQSYVQKFLDATGWQPSLAKSFAGGLPYTRYSPWIRWMMKMISRRTGRPTDTSRDYDFTDWSEVDRFAGRFAGLFAVTASGVAAAAAAAYVQSDLDEIC